jgi:hypothetical protein
MRNRDRKEGEGGRKTGTHLFLGVAPGWDGANLVDEVVVEAEHLSRGLEMRVEGREMRKLQVGRLMTGAGGSNGGRTRG